MSSRTVAPPRARATGRAASPRPRPHPATRHASGRSNDGSRPRVDPRIAERRIAVSREVGRQRLRRLLVGLALVVALGAAGGAVLSPLLDVDHFDVRGADDRVADVIAASRIERGAPILLADIGAAERRIAALPWVGSVHVERALLGTIRISVVASVPVAWAFAADGTVAYLDARGRPQVAGVVNPGDPAASGLPELVVAPEDLAPGARLAALGAARVAASLGPLAGGVAAITVVDGVATLRLRTGPEVRYGSLTRLFEKARAAAAVLAAPGIDEAAYIDVSVPAAPVTG